MIEGILDGDRITSYKKISVNEYIIKNIIE